jgi:hypothetical protein
LRGQPHQAKPSVAVICDPLIKHHPFYALASRWAVSTQPLRRSHISIPKMTANVPRPGPANLGPNAGLDEWLEEAKQCHYLPERAMKELCEKVKEILMEGTEPITL